MHNRTAEFIVVHTVHRLVFKTIFKITVEWRKKETIESNDHHLLNFEIGKIDKSIHMNSSILYANGEELQGICSFKFISIDIAYYIAVV